jgi:hypothetical protein
MPKGGLMDPTMRCISKREIVNPFKIYIAKNYDIKICSRDIMFYFQQLDILRQKLLSVRAKKFLKTAL